MILFSAGCAHRAATANVPPPPTPSSTQPPTSTPGAPSASKPRGSAPQAPVAGESGAGYVEEGVASWYGFPFQGRRASDGEIYDMNQMTAAHRTLPFNSIVRVTNLSNGLQTEVRIIDRGPFVEGRIIDLSLAAAKALDIVATGTAPVRLELVSAGPIELPASPAGTPAAPAKAQAVTPTGTPAATTDVKVGIFAVQIGAFADAAKADKLRDQLTVSYPSVSVQKFDLPTGAVYRVFVGRYTFEAAAQEVAAQLQAEHGYTAFVVRVDPVN
ncbi:MAG: septal ring lytic transglycosylase RlpA family protein [Candidatus Acidiferrales bacterium]